MSEKYAGQNKAAQVLKTAGYAKGGAVKDGAAKEEAEDKAIAKRAIAQHEAHDHKGEKKTKLKLKHGGHVEGGKAKHRLDKMARGGANKHKNSKDAKTKVNVIVAPGAGAAGQKPVTMPPMPMPARPMPPQGAPAMPQQPPMKRGGKAKKYGGEVPMTAGGGGAKGRLEKAAIARKDGIKPRAKGGKC